MNYVTMDPHQHIYSKFTIQWQEVYSNTHRNPLRATGASPDNPEWDWQQKGAGYGTSL